jgi:hypothetical protein
MTHDPRPGTAAVIVSDEQVKTCWLRSMMPPNTSTTEPRIALTAVISPALPVIGGLRPPMLTTRRPPR